MSLLADGFKLLLKTYGLALLRLENGTGIEIG